MNKAATVLAGSVALSLLSACGSPAPGASPPGSPPGGATPTATPSPSIPPPPPGSTASATIKLPDGLPATLDAIQIRAGCAHTGDASLVESFTGSSGGQTLTVTISYQATPATQPLGGAGLPRIDITDAAHDTWTSTAGTLQIGPSSSATAELARPGQPATMQLTANWSCG